MSIVLKRHTTTPSSVSCKYSMQGDTEAFPRNSRTLQLTSGSLVGLQAKLWNMEQDINEGEVLS
jgi:hypothetical protein